MSEELSPLRRKIFVVGTGRSGTHWLGYILDDHPDVCSTIEKPSIFDKVTKAALDFSKKDKLVPPLEDLYAAEHDKCERHYMDKSHPNLWHVQELASYFPEARFIAIRREVYPTVASMLRHPGVLSWQKKWREFPVPNPFLGITKENASDYRTLRPAAQCALRWKSHSDQIDLLERQGELLVVEYENLLDNTEREASRIWKYCGLDPIELNVEKKQGTNDKWKSQLSAEDIAAIDRIIRE